MSDDGRFVAFTAFATNLVAGDTNGEIDILVRDRSKNRTARVNTTATLEQAVNGSSEAPAMSGDGRTVAFASWATNLVDPDGNGSPDVFLRAQPVPTVTMVSPSFGTAGTNVGVSIIGTSFLPGAEVSFQPAGITATVTNVTDTTITATLTIPANAPLGRGRRHRRQSRNRPRRPVRHRRQVRRLLHGVVGVPRQQHRPSLLPSRSVTAASPRRRAADWPLVGREAQLGWIADALSRPECRGVVLAGAAGVGKTRLAGEALALGEQAGRTVVRTAATSSTSVVPLGALLPLLGSSSDTLAGPDLLTRAQTGPHVARRRQPPDVGARRCSPSRRRFRDRREPSRHP